MRTALLRLLTAGLSGGALPPYQFGRCWTYTGHGLPPCPNGVRRF
jgi:hypothetical protein